MEAKVLAFPTPAQGEGGLSECEIVGMVDTLEKVAADLVRDVFRKKGIHQSEEDVRRHAAMLIYSARIRTSLRR